MCLLLACGVGGANYIAGYAVVQFLKRFCDFVVLWLADVFVGFVLLWFLALLSGRVVLLFSDYGLRLCGFVVC